MTPTNPVVEEKRKHTKKSVRYHKKRKGNKTIGTVSVTNDDYTLLKEIMTEISNQSLQKIYEQQTELNNNITYIS